MSYLPDLQINTVTGNATMYDSIEIALADASGGALSVTLTDPAFCQQLVIKKIDSSINSVTILPASGTIDGASSKVLTLQYDYKVITSDGTNYFII